MASGSTFGSDPDRLRRLLSIGVETHAPAEASGAIDPRDVLLEKPGARVGRYEILRVLGEGGMGIVYLAQQHEPIKRQVALKVIKPGMDSRRVIARFEAEQQALAMIDFGVARALTRSLAEQTLTSEPGQIIGTPEYMSPEQALGNPDIDTRSDVYSLGVVLYRLLCGSLPHETQLFRRGGIETIRKVLT